MENLDNLEMQKLELYDPRLKQKTSSQNEHDVVYFLLIPLGNQNERPQEKKSRRRERWMG